MKLISYFKDVKGEMKHVSWPTRRQTMLFTTLVIILSIVTAMFLGAFDTFFTFLLGEIV